VDSTFAPIGAVFVLDRNPAGIMAITEPYLRVHPERGSRHCRRDDRAEGKVAHEFFSCVGYLKAPAMCFAAR
jgi:hypothetical protein